MPNLFYITIHLSQKIDYDNGMPIFIKDPTLSRCGNRKLKFMQKVIYTSNCFLKLRKLCFRWDVFAILEENHENGPDHRLMKTV